MSSTSKYAEAGVDIDTGNRLVERIKPVVKRTFRPEVITDIGGFAALFSMNSSNYQDPVLVSSTDGVGTKLRVAFMTGNHGTVGIDLVAMCVNDIIVEGAEPLFFLDYFGTGHIEEQVAFDVISGIAEGCSQAGCALIGGETAEMPSFYGPGEYDLAGFVVGVVEKSKILDGSDIHVGHKLIGISSSGLHSNGYSLIRKILFEQKGLSVDDRVEGMRGTVGEELLIPTKIYAKTILNLLRDFPISGMANITGGGLTENLPRILPEGASAVIETSLWKKPFIFDYIQTEGEIPEEEMYCTFNQGIGLVLVTPPEEAENVLIRLEGLKEEAWIIGEIVSAKDATDRAICYK